MHNKLNLSNPPKLPTQNLEKSAELAKKVREQVPQAIQEKREQAEAAVDRFEGFVTDPAVYGRSIGVDERGRRPRPFGYGEHGRTLRELDRSGPKETSIEETNTDKTPMLREKVTVTNQRIARMRAFGTDDANHLTITRGLEGELGFRHTRHQDHHATAGGRGRVIGSKDEDLFAGLQGRAFAGAGPLGAAAGGEGFAGVRYFGEDGFERGGTSQRERVQIDAGAGGAGTVQAGLINRLYGHAEAGLRGRYEHQTIVPVAGDIGGFNRVNVDGFAGALARFDAKAGLTGVGAGAEAFAGVRAGISDTFGIAYKGQEVAGVGVRGEAWAGVGAKLDVGADVDLEDRRVDIEADAGAAVGVGGSVGGVISIGGSDSDVG